MTPIHGIDEGLERLAALLDRLDPTPDAVCTVAGCVHHHAHHDTHSAFAGALAA